MCDTFVSLGNNTLNGKTIFAKNSDREPSEAQVLVHYPRKVYQLDHTPTLRCTYIAIPQVALTYEVFLSQPYWMWGAEMGSNEFGLTIGNEAVFTKEEPGASALTGMDLLRLALERCQTAAEALDCIIELLEKYGQGGNCGYQKKLNYDNSFLLVDPKEAYVLETAGKFWVSKKVKDFYAISNGLTIGSNFDRSHPDLISHALAKGYCKKAEDFHFAHCYGRSLHRKATRCQKRRTLVENLLAENSTRLTPLTMRRILSAHQSDQKVTVFRQGSMSDVCMHAGGVISSQTTQSMIAQLSLAPEENLYWITGSSLPCISLFKPYRLGELTQKAKLLPSATFWHRREELRRRLLGRDASTIETLYALTAKYQEDIDCLFPLEKQSGTQLTTEIIQKAFALDEAFTKEMENFLPLPQLTPKRGNLYFRHYWKKENRILKASKKERT